MTGPGGGAHVGDALVFGSDAELVELVAPFLRGGLAAGEAVVLVCADRRSALLVDAVGADPRLAVLPVPQVWRRPLDAMRDYERLIEQEVRAGRRLRVVADSDFGAGPLDWSEWARFEAASHHSARADPVWSICLLDRREAPEPVIAATERLHANCWNHGVRTGSPTYAAPAENLRRDAYVRTDPLERTPPAVRADDVAGPSDLAGLRHAVGTELARAGVPPWRSHEFVLAVSEMVANAIRHGRPPVRARLWSTPRRVLCTVTDAGAGFDLPLSSYLFDPAQPGLGLHLARQLCDQLNLCWTPAGFTVRLALLAPVRWGSEAVWS